MAAIGFYEISTHEHNLYYFLRIADAAGHDITVFTHTETAEAVSELLADTADTICWVCKTDDESIQTFLSRVEQICDEKLDLFVAQSLYPQTAELPSYVRFNPECERLLWIYNVNRWFSSIPSFDQRIVWNVHMFLRKLVYRKFDALCVQYPPMADYIRENFDVSKPVYVLPSTLYDDDPGRSTDTIRFTIPGQIEAKRRDYELVLNVFADLFEEYEDDIELHLLGRPSSQYGYDIIDRCRDLAETGYDVVYYEDWIPREDYDRTLRNSSFLLCPLRPTIEGRDVVEKYGTTKGSGNVFDALRNAKPIILPEHFEIADMIQGSAIHYENRSDLVAEIEYLLDDPDRLETIRRNARENAEQFTLESQSKRFDDVVTELLNA